MSRYTLDMLFARNVWLKRLVSFLIGYLRWEWLVDPMRFQGWLERQIENNTGYQIELGKIDHRWYRPGILRISHIDISGDRAIQSLRVSQIDVSVGLRQLLKRTVHIEHLLLEAPVVVYHHNSKNIEHEKEKSPPQPFLPWQVQLDKLELNNTHITVHHQDKSAVWREGYLLVTDLQIPAESAMTPQVLKVDATVRGTLDFSPFSIQIDTLNAHLNEGKLKVESVKLTGEELTLNAQAVVQLSDPAMPVNLTITQSRVTFTEALQTQLPPGLAINGHLQSQLQVDLLAQGNILPSVTGKASIQSDNITITGVDLDNLFDGLIAAESTSLLDVGSFILTGPVGLIASQVVSLGETGLTTEGGYTPVTALNMDVSIKDGVLTTEDVAFATHHHLTSLNGQIDVVNHVFQTLHFYLLDDENCALVDQTLNGKWDAPEGLTGALASTTVVKPFTNILKKAGKLLKKCEPVYDGKVVFPASS